MRWGSPPVVRARGQSRQLPSGDVRCVRQPQRLYTARPAAVSAGRPEEWLDAAHRERWCQCGMPDETLCKTKQALALEMVQVVVTEGGPRFRWLTCDAAFGRDGVFLGWIAAPGPWRDTEADARERRVAPWGEEQARVWHRRGASAREEARAGGPAVPVHTRAGWWSLRRAWLRPPRGLSQDHWPRDGGFVALAHHGRRRGNAWRGALLELWLTELQQSSQERLAPSSSVVDKRQAAHGEWPVVLGETAMRTQPGAPQGPQALQRLAVPCMQALAVVIPRLFPPAVTDACRRRAPRCQAALTSVRRGRQTGPRRHRRGEQGLARPGWDVVQPPHAHRAPALAHPEARGLLRGEGAAAAGPRETSAPPAPPFVPTAAGVPVWPATRETAAPSPASVHVGAGFWRTRPWRHGLVSGGASSVWRARSGAMGGCARVRPRPYRPSIHPRRGG